MLRETQITKRTGDKERQIFLQIFLATIISWFPCDPTLGSLQTSFNLKGRRLVEHDKSHFQKVTGNNGNEKPIYFLVNGAFSNL